MLYTVSVLYLPREGRLRLLDVLSEAVRVLLRERPGNDGSDCADKEEEHERTMGHPVSFRHRKCMWCYSLVDLSVRELQLRADDTPDNASGEEHLGVRARESVLLVRRAHVICSNGRHKHLGPLRT